MQQLARNARYEVFCHISTYNIIGQPDFKSSKDVFKAILKKFCKAGKDSSSHHPTIPTAKIELIRNYASVTRKSSRAGSKSLPLVKNERNGA